jgi:hypothetical protein
MDHTDLEGKYSHADLSRYLLLSRYACPEEGWWFETTTTEYAPTPG